MQYLTPQSTPVQPPPVSPVAWLAPRRILTWVYLVRFAISAAIFLAAVLVWQAAARTDTLAASLVFAAVMIFTAASALYTEVYRGRITQPLLYAQALFDVALVTAITHVTWEGNSSQFSPLYILVIAVAALLLPARGVWIVAALAIVLYVAEAVIVQDVVIDLTNVFQLAVFGLVAIGSGLIAMRLRAEGTGREALAEELARFRLHQGDVERLHLRAERLEAVAELGASLAHEIKNPLASIRSAVEQLAATPRATDDERTLATLVQRESDRLSRLLTGFLDFSRVDVAHVKILDLTPVIRQAGELVYANPGKPAGVHIEFDLPRSAIEVRGDEDMLHRAFSNLILNAVQASPPNGLVRVEATTLLPHQVTSHAPAFSRGAIAVRVIDQGPGIPEQVRAKLFHPFFSTKAGGSGLGLAIVHRAIEAHSGVVIADSDHRGARFTVLLPRL